MEERIIDKLEPKAVVNEVDSRWAKQFKTTKQWAIISSVMTGLPSLTGGILTLTDVSKESFCGYTGTLVFLSLTAMSKFVYEYTKLRRLRKESIEPDITVTDSEPAAADNFEVASTEQPSLPQPDTASALRESGWKRDDSEEIIPSATALAPLPYGEEPIFERS